MAKTPLFRGSCTAIITPFTKTGVDYEQLERNIEFQYENGTAAVVACGTTGENATLTGGEHSEVIRRVITHGKGRLKVIAGVGREQHGARSEASRGRRSSWGQTAYL